MSSSESQMSNKRKLCEEDENSFDDPCIELKRICVRALEDMIRAQEEEESLEDLKHAPSPPLPKCLINQQQFSKDVLKQTYRGRGPSSHGRLIRRSVPIPDFGPSYLYYRVVQACARVAIANYNETSETSPYKFVKIDSVASKQDFGVINGIIYDITFQAECPGKLATFEAQLHVYHHAAGTEVNHVCKKSEKDLAIGMGHQTDIKTDCKGDETKTYKSETIAKKKIKRPRVVEITDEAADCGAFILKQFISRRGAIIREKLKELSPQDAAVIIQMNFRAYMIRRSHAIRALRELAIAKIKLKELRELFDNSTYRRRVAWDVEERQRFTEKINILLLTVNAVEGVGLTVKSARKSMVDKLETMIDVVDPQPASRSLSTRTFDMPNAD